MANEAINIANLLRGGEYEIETQADKQKSVDENFARLRREGKI